MTYPLDTSHALNDPGIRHEGDHYSIHVNEKRSLLDYTSPLTDVRDHTIDRTALFQAAANSVPQSDPPHYGGGIYVPSGQWRLNSTVDITRRGVRFYGDGGSPTAAGGGIGATIIVAPGITGFSYDPGATTLWHEGPTLEGLNFHESGDFSSVRTATLVYIRNTNHATLRDLSLRFAGVGLDMPHTDPPTAGMDSSWHDLDNLKLYRCTTGLRMSGMGNGRALTFIDCFDWAFVLEGTASQGRYEGKIDGAGNKGIWCKGHVNNFLNWSFEGCNPAYRFGGDSGQSYFGAVNRVLGGNISMASTSHVAIQIDTPAVGTVIDSVIPWGNADPANWIVETSGDRRTIVRGAYKSALTDEHYAFPAGQATPTANPPSGGYLHVPANATTQLKWRTSAGLVYDLARHMSGTGTPEGTATAPIGTLYSRLDAPDNDSALYVKTTGTGNTGWRRVATLAP